MDALYLAFRDKRIAGADTVRGAIMEMTGGLFDIRWMGMMRRAPERFMDCEFLITDTTSTSPSASTVTTYILLRCSHTSDLLIANGLHGWNNR